MLNIAGKLGALGVTKTVGIVVGATSTTALIATGMAIRSASKAKRAMKDVQNLESKVNKLTEKVKDLNQNKINERKLYEIDRDVEILKNRRELNELLMKMNQILEDNSFEEGSKRIEKDLKEMDKELNDLLDDKKKK